MRMRIVSLSVLSAVAVSASLVSGCGSEDTTGGGVSTSQPLPAAADQASADGRGRYAEINGGRLYYESRGAGQPLILLHGGLSTAESTFGAFIPELSENRRVISVELQAHGHTPDRERPLSYESMADDVAALITHLNLGKADLFGYSLGGGVAMQVAAGAPDLVGRLVVMSAPYRSDGWMPDTRAGMAAMEPDAMRDTPMYQLYRSVAPDPAGWTSLVTKTRQLLAQDYDWGAQLVKIQAPTLVLVAESDALYREHATDMVSRLDTGAAASARLEIVPSTTHYDIMYRSDLILPTLTSFLASATIR
ncbi:alpha/beta fold hydrolase [Nocardia amikacinitolerans]|uniref:alpha/beta fold hydrolase n=1 Tax=Nocardia amikacinitolerans TaxID=756689 RepID=UPI0020A44F78|nr:alpha/beta hydrolase [Nocardia amikacinitolerans]MCP2275060.1 Pimeloyl-ACP methyl ester carboxylesterase [Nocardia amikacinitolerans]